MVLSSSKADAWSAVKCLLGQAPSGDSPGPNDVPTQSVKRGTGQDCYAKNARARQSLPGIPGIVTMHGWDMADVSRIRGWGCDPRLRDGHPEAFAQGRCTTPLPDWCCGEPRGEKIPWWSARVEEGPGRATQQDYSAESSDARFAGKCNSLIFPELDFMRTKISMVSGDLSRNVNPLK